MDPQSKVSEEIFDPSKVKRCTICGHVKPKEKFTKDTHRRDGLRIRCIACDRRYQRFRALVKSLDNKADVLDNSIFLTNMWSLRYLYERATGHRRPTRDGVLFVADVQLDGAMERKRDGLVLQQVSGELFLKVWTPAGVKTFNLATVPSLQIVKEITAMKVHILAPRSPKAKLLRPINREMSDIF